MKYNIVVMQVLVMFTFINQLNIQETISRIVYLKYYNVSKQRARKQCDKFFTENPDKLLKFTSLNGDKYVKNLNAKHRIYKCLTLDEYKQMSNLK